MSIRLGRSRTCFRREKLLRARGATAVLLKVVTASLYGVQGLVMAERVDGPGRTGKQTGRWNRAVRRRNPEG